MLQHLEGADRHAELLALAGVVDGVGQHARHRAVGFRGQRDHGLVAQPLDQREGLAFGADALAGRHLYVVEPHLGCARAVEGGIFAQGHAGRVACDPEQADAPAVAARACGAGADHQVRGERRAHHRVLVPAQLVAIASARGAGLHVMPAIAAGGFGMRPGGGGLAADDGGQPLRGQFGAALRQRAAGQHHGAQVRLEHQVAAELFHHDHVLGSAAAQPAERLGKARAQDAEVARKGTPAIGAPACG
ncbi:hypothetical protein D9M68_753440 [compost metagenome]